MDEITEKTFERVGHLIFSSKTLRRYGYRHAQKGHLTETQGKAAIQVLDFWIRSKIEQHQQG